MQKRNSVLRRKLEESLSHNEHRKNKSVGELEEMQSSMALTPRGKQRAPKLFQSG